MKLNPTVALTLLLLVMMAGAGAVSAAWGFVVGREALKGITQPDTRPTNNQAIRKRNTSQNSGLVIVREEDILATVKARMEGSLKDSSISNPDAGKRNEKAGSDKAAVKFPLVSQNKGVSLEVRSVRRQGDSLVMDVGLRNESGKAIQFLYSFLTVTDDRGRVLNASTEGLPAELPSNSERFSGTVRIPTALLQETQKLSMSLTDYPDQQLQLQLADIPVK